MNLAQLRAFTSVARSGSVSDAALQLGLTQSAVSHALASLERELGTRLIVRDRAGCLLTELGGKLLPDASDALRHADRIAEVAAAAAGLRQGRLRIGLIPSASGLLLPLIAQFRHRYPGIAVAVFEGTDQEVSDWIDDRTVDLGVVTGPRPDLETVPLAEDEMLAVVSSGHRLAERADISVAGLAGEPFLLSAGGCEPAIRRLHDQHHVPLAPASRVTDMATLLAMVREGLGVSIIPALSLGTSHEGITALPLRPRAPRILLLSGRDAGASPAACSFLSHVREASLPARTIKSGRADHLPHCDGWRLVPGGQGGRVHDVHHWPHAGRGGVPARVVRQPGELGREQLLSRCRGRAAAPGHRHHATGVAAAARRRARMG
jgi:DNA-binding transcriptional LysR family regulator